MCVKRKSVYTIINAAGQVYKQETGATTSHTRPESRFSWREPRRQESGFDDEGRGRMSVDGRRRDGLNSP